MLILQRKQGQSILINDDIEISVVEVSKDKIKIGIDAPLSVKVFRKEIILTKNENIEASKNVNKGLLENLVKNLDKKK